MNIYIFRFLFLNFNTPYIQSYVIGTSQILWVQLLEMVLVTCHISICETYECTTIQVSPYSEILVIFIVINCWFFYLELVIKLIWLRLGCSKQSKIDPDWCGLIETF